MTGLSSALGGGYTGMQAGRMPMGPGEGQALTGAGPTVLAPGLRPEMGMPADPGFLALLMRLLAALGSGGPTSSPPLRTSFTESPTSDR